jgi:hypothetical protein
VYGGPESIRMSSAAIEAFLANIYTNPDACARFKANPLAEASRAGLSAEECSAVANIDWPGLELATQSFARKRHGKARSPKPSTFARLREFFGNTLRFFHWRRHGNG